MSVMQYNKNPISMREGKQLGEKTPSSRWLGATITGSITRRRSTPWLKETIKKYLNDKGTPEFKIQGVMDDENSDYYVENGSNVITCVGCVLTGDLNLINLDSGGDVVDDVIAFNAKDIV